MIYRFEDFLFDGKARELRRGGEVCAVEPQVFALLELLIENANRMVSKDDIVEMIWGGRIVSDGSINSRIKSLRKILDDDGKQQRLIKTLHGQGFRFVGTLEPVSLALEAPKLTKKNDVSLGPAGAHIASIPTVAVLAFDNMSGHPEQGHLADGMCEDIITILSKISGLKVIARNTSFAYKGRAVDIKKIGEQLGASHVLEGSVRRSGDRLRVTGQLIETENSTHVWAERYDRKLDDFFAIQDDMTRQIVNALQVELLEGGAASYWAGGTRSFEAWWQQTQAMPLVVRTHLREDILRGRAHAQAALDIDPDYAEAWVTKGFSHIFEAIGCWTENPDGNITRAVDVFNKAYELNPGNALVVAGKGFAKIYRNQHDEGMALVDRAAKMAPDNLQIIVQRGFAKLYCGQYDKKIHPQLNLPDVLKTMLPIQAASIHAVRGEMEEALKFAEASIRQIPDYLRGHAMAALAQAALGKEKEALASVKKVMNRNPAFCMKHYWSMMPLHDQAILEGFFKQLATAGVPN